VSRVLEAGLLSDPSRRRLALGGLLALLVAAVAATVAYAGLAGLTEVASSAAVDLLERDGLAALLGVFVLERGWLGVRQAHLERFDAWFDRWGPVAVPVSNAMVFVRGIATVPAGLSHMGLRTFLVLSAVGTLCFEAALAVLTLGVLETV